MRNHRLLRLLPYAAMLALAASLAGCSRVRVVAHADPHWQQRGLRTYAWKSGAPSLGDPRLDEEALGRAMMQSADAELAGLGYRLVTAGEPDFLMGHRLDLGQADREPEGLDPLTAGDAGWVRFWETWEYEPSPDERALVLYAVDPAVDKLVWQGVGYVIVDFEASHAKQSERVRQDVRKILREFPRAE